MAIDWGRIYIELSHLIETMPAFDSTELSRDDHTWLGRAYALILESNGAASIETIGFRSAIDNYPSVTWAHHVGVIRGGIFRAFGVAERNAPATASGSFIPVAAAFEAFASVAKVVASAKVDVMFLDPYLDATALTDFAPAVPEKVSLRLLGDKAFVKSTLSPAASAWQKQYGSSRPLDVRVSQPRDLHDRAIFVDGKEVWLLSQSFNALAARSPATIQRANDAIAAEKIAAYVAIWARSPPIT